MYKKEDFSVNDYNLCVNWFTFTYLWRKTYKSKAQVKKFTLWTKTPLNNTNNENVDSHSFHSLFDITEDEYNSIMHGTSRFTSDKFMKKEKQTLADKTGLDEPLFSGARCIIPLIDDTTKQKIKNYAQARFLSNESLGYRDEEKKILRLIETNISRDDFSMLIEFINTGQPALNKTHLIRKHIVALNDMSYKKLLKYDLEDLGNYKKAIEQQLKLVEAIIIHKQQMQQ